SGNAYVAGSLSAGGIYLAKFGANGSLAWLKQLGSGSGHAYSIALDGSGNIYSTGEFYGKVDFDPGPGTFTLTNSNTFGAAFVQKLNANGDFVWARAFQPNNLGSSHGEDIVVDGSG